jgi:hypothetical protein
LIVRISTLMNDAKYIGMDVHQATISVVAVRDSRGNLVMEAILETKAETILQFIRGLRGAQRAELAEILQRFIHNGDETSLTELSGFLDTTQLPLGAHGFLDVWQFVFYFWFGVLLLCIFALLVAVLRHFQHRARANAAI